LGFNDEFADSRELNPFMYNSFHDGTKVAIEMCATANATGLSPDVPGMHLPTAEIPEIPQKLRPKADGGLLDSTGVVDTINTRYSDGSAVERDIGFGVFVVTEATNEDVREYFEQQSGTGFYTANEGKYQLFYRPYHLPGIETGISVANAALRNEATGAPRVREAEVVGAAKRDLTPGDTIDKGGGYTVYGTLVSAMTADDNRYIPLELLEDADVVREIRQDDVVTYDDVELQDDRFIYTLRQLQDESTFDPPGTP
jgi:predicted homoserine dehydrogenase-like protein